MTPQQHSRQLRWTSVRPFVASLLAWLLISASPAAQATASVTKVSAKSGTGFAQQHRTDLILKLRFINQPGTPQTTQMARKVLGEEVDLAEFSERLEIHGQTYRIDSEIPMIRAVAMASSLDKVRRFSEGQVGPTTGITGQRVMEQRGSKSDIYEARLSKDRKKVEFFKNRRKTGEDAIGHPQTDLASLPYYWLGKSVKAQSITLDVFDAKKTYKRQQFAAKAVDIQYLGQTIRAVQFTKVKKDAKDAELILLVRQSDGAPLRIDLGLSAKYGVSALIYPKVIPKAFPALASR